MIMRVFDETNTFADLAVRKRSSSNQFCATAPTIDVSSQDYVGNEIVTLGALYSANCNVVHKTQNEDVHGIKNFIDSTLFSNTIQFQLATNDSFSAPSDSLSWGRNINFYTNKQVASLLYGGILDNNSTRIGMRVYKRKTSDSDADEYRGIQIRYDISERQYIGSIEADKTLSRVIIPAADNTYTLGIAGAKWSQVWAGSGTIQTSDESLKTEISDINEAVLRAWGKVKFQQFKFKDSVAKKGNKARIHMGVIAQRIDEAFKSEGLDARNYGLFCWDEWEDQYEDVDVLVKPEVRGMVKVVDTEAVYNIVTKEDFSEERVLVTPEKSHMEEKVIEEAVYKTEKKLIRPAGSQYSVRYDQCLCLECAYQRWRLDQLEAKLA